MIVGIDIGGTSTKLGLVQDDRVVARDRIPTTEGGSPEHYVDALAKAVQDLTRDVRSVGIGAPNGNQLTGVIERAPNLPWKGDVPLARMLSDRLGVPCALGNDANAAALGEWRFGAGRGLTDLMVVTLGTGLGSGLIVDSRLLLGPFGNAGELGHMTLVMDGRSCTCGRKGCLEAYVSIRGMRRTYMELLSENGEEAPTDEDGVLPIAQAAINGQASAVQTFMHTARWLGVGLANAVAITAPQKVILFGGIARNGDLLMKPLQDWFGRSLLNIHQGRVLLGQGELPEDDAGILGAAALGAVG
ncbi:MAG: ROK family protein [Flavobacteriales bacterium]|nr:ROK family protein [Flavobacteriales bacterium]MCB9193888.1 ROK family protein [Flavobacteriales bacterium]